MVSAWAGWLQASLSYCICPEVHFSTGPYIMVQTIVRVPMVISYGGDSSLGQLPNTNYPVDSTMRLHRMASSSRGLLRRFSGDRGLP